jgi:hypothetical protein
LDSSKVSAAETLSSESAEEYSERRPLASRMVESSSPQVLRASSWNSDVRTGEGGETERERQTERQRRQRDREEGRGPIILRVSSSLRRIFFGYLESSSPTHLTLPPAAAEMSVRKEGRPPARGPAS